MDYYTKPGYGLTSAQCVRKVDLYELRINFQYLNFSGAKKVKIASGQGNLLELSTRISLYQTLIDKGGINRDKG